MNKKFPFFILHSHNKHHAQNNPKTPSNTALPTHLPPSLSPLLLLALRIIVIIHLPAPPLPHAAAKLLRATPLAAPVCTGLLTSSSSSITSPSSAASSSSLLSSPLPSAITVCIPNLMYRMKFCKRPQSTRTTSHDPRLLLQARVLLRIGKEYIVDRLCMRGPFYSHLNRLSLNSDLTTQKAAPRSHSKLATDSLGFTYNV